MSDKFISTDNLAVYNGLIRGDTTPLEDSTPSTGTSKKFARADHVHPHDSTKVDKVTGKGLSSEDFTTAEKTKLSNFPDASNIVLTTQKGQSNGVCELDANGLIPTSRFPSFVDDVIEAYPVSGATELTAGWLSLTSGGSAFSPETGKIYILMEATTSYAVNSQFRWSGTTYIKMLDGGMRPATTAEIEAIVNS